jgi:hypothetical protein
MVSGRSTFTWTSPSVVSLFDLVVVLVAVSAGFWESLEQPPMNQAVTPTTKSVVRIARIRERRLLPLRLNMVTPTLESGAAT